MSDIETARTMIKILTGKENVLFTTRCNESIRVAMLLVALEDRANVLYQEEGGWLTYEKYIKQANLNPIKLVTNFGLVYPSELKIHELDSALIINSLAGYIAPQDMDEIFTQCLKHDIFLVNDVSGSIGSTYSKQGDIIVGSFGPGKPVDLGTGGFIATQSDALFEKIKEITGSDYVEPELNYKLLVEKLKNLESRRDFLENKAKQIKSDLSDMEIVHKDLVGLNVVVLFDDENQKKKITDYCDENNLEYTVCPREIRVLEPAISIEVKRLTNLTKKTLETNQ
ncbi:DegT/DnrJ/EryC1/StrS aminotransferase family protein [Candidatus Woesearchaeota archaeon]|nr:DegT/DnrJ/EryC1/StrS aminotransferase family protein [Candidatus Woesearchaeota archaeon]